MKEDKIIIKGAREHNLKNINLEIPHNQLVVISGVSGSGKSSLAFDTIFAEGQRQYVESLSPYIRQFLGQKRPAEVDEIAGLAPAISIDQKALSHNPRSTVGTLTEIYDYLRVLYARLGEVFCPLCQKKIQKLSLEEMIDIIIGRGEELKEEYVSILSPVVQGRKGEYYQLLYDFLSLGYSRVLVDGQIYSLREQIKLDAKKKHDISLVIDQVLLKDQSRLFEATENALNHSDGLVLAVFGDLEKGIVNSEWGKKRKLQTQEEDHFLRQLFLSAKWSCPDDNFAFPELEPRLFSFNSPYGACPNCHGLGKMGWGEEEEICPECQGQRLKPESLSVRIKGKNIAEVAHLPINRALAFFNDYYEKMSKHDRQIAEAVMVQIISRLEFLSKVGLNYLSLDREAETLSGGEAQRIRLSSQIGSQLSRTLYVLDEPTIGLHEKDTDRLIETLKSLRDKNNSLIVVEHDERTIRESDYLIDLGPYAGVHGGEVVAQGITKELLNSESKQKSLTLDYLRGQRKINLPKRRDSDTESIKIIGARANNLKNINVEIPLKKLVAITGVSGSGKSSLLYDVIYKNVSKVKNRPSLKAKIEQGGENLKELEQVANIKGVEYINKIIVIDQAPIGRTPRSNPATYTGIFTPIRDFYAALPESRERAYTISRFSFNRPGGRCESCEGAGFNLIEMHFLPPVLVECEVCHGRRFNRETLAVKYKGKSIADVLDLTISEAMEFFEDNYHIVDKLKVLNEVGLGYLKLGQSATTLSGGEAQRIKLARELTHSLGQKTLYLLDEPTTGLHHYDIDLLLKVLNKLVDKGNSVLLIEHNLHVIKSVDWLIDLGPEGGEEGGKVMAYGMPEDIVRNDNSVTGKYLKPYLK